MDNKLILPAAYTALDEEEMTYLDGGDIFTSLGLGGFVLKCLVVYAAVQVASTVLPAAISYAYNKVTDLLLAYKPMPIDDNSEQLSAY